MKHLFCFCLPLQELCCTAFLWPGVIINSPGSWRMLQWCFWRSSCQSWGFVLCLTFTTSITFPTCTPCTAGLESPPQLFSPHRYATLQTESESLHNQLFPFWALLMIFCSLCLWMPIQWVFGMIGFLLPCTQIALRKFLKPIHVWFGSMILMLSIVACISGINEKLFFALWVPHFLLLFHFWGEYSSLSWLGDTCSYIFIKKSGNKWPLYQSFREQP